MATIVLGPWGLLRVLRNIRAYAKIFRISIAYAQVRRTAKGGKPIPLENTLLQVQKSFIKVSDLCGQMSKDAIELSETCNQLVVNMDFKVLFDRQRKLFSIGYMSNMENLMILIMISWPPNQDSPVLLP
jgi:hypothetical protein